MTNVDIVKQLGAGEEIILSANEAASLSLYIGELKTLCEIGKSFIAAKRTAVICGIEKALSGVSAETIKAIAEKMSVSELDELYRAFQKEKGAKVQLAPKTKINKSENSDFNRRKKYETHLSTK